MNDINQQLAGIFQQMADLLELLDANRFRINAFQRAARVLGEMTGSVADIDPQQLTDIEGIGKGTAERISEFLQTGKIEEHEDLLAQVPAGLLKLLDIPSLGPKTVAQLWRQAAVTDVAGLRQKLESGELQSLKGFGAKKIENIRQNLAFMDTANQRRRIGDVLPLARWYLDRLTRLKEVIRADYAGSLRRGRETIGDLDLLVAAKSDDAPAISQAFIEMDKNAQVIAKGKTKTAIRTAAGIQIDLRIVEEESFGAALMYFTGSKEHNVRMRERAISMGMTLNEYGLWKDARSSRTSKKGEENKAQDKSAREQAGEMVTGKSEEEVFRSLKLTWVPPELREDRGELALAEKDKLPELVELKHIRAELHAHTTASDGVWSIRELAMYAANRGFHTVAITDHSKSQVQAGGLDAKRLEEHIQAVRDVAAELKGTIQLLAGSEVDILSDGRLDYPNSLLKALDIVVASPHVALSQDAATATKRLLKAMDNPYVTILGHPTGRLINRRQGLSPDMKKLIDAAAQRGVAMELNANHYRLDLRDTHARAAIEAGVKLAINTDAHGPADFDQLIYGILTARRAGATRKDVINCMSQSSLSKWIAGTRG